jgi:hypothetical protein
MDIVKPPRATAGVCQQNMDMAIKGWQHLPEIRPSLPASLNNGSIREETRGRLT